MLSIMESSGPLHPITFRLRAVGNREAIARPQSMLMQPPSRRAAILTALALVAFALSWGPAQDEPKPPSSPQTLFDERLATLRVASVTWMNRPGPKRKVVDQVCLVPDLPSFFAALATWDDGHYFPILLDDPESNLRFLRAFRPRRVVRLPRAAGAIPDDQLWKHALEAVGKSWTVEGQEPPPGDEVPEILGPTPPGVVVSTPASQTLAGAVALAAGRFQPLVRWDFRKKDDAALDLEAAARMMQDLEFQVAAVVTEYRQLGDDCDFLTLAGDWPDRYAIPEGQKKGVAALDDLLSRRPDGGRRWAYVGRLIGDPAGSVYQAMCSLFLQPESALLFNAYDEQGMPWSEYQMRDATRRLSQELRTFHRVGPDEANLAGWHRVFDPINRHGLVLINSSGGENNFNLPGGAGQTADVPMSVPAAVLMIHSFSATRPADVGTVAGRWRANGAFLYFGSMNEPYLNAFRTPTLVANLLADNLPVSAAVRKIISEDPFGTPWRLIFLGDPLYRLDPDAAKAPRVQPRPPTDRWPALAGSAPPAAGASDADRLRWGLTTALVQAARLEGGPARAEWQNVILAIRREALPASARPIYDALLADVITFARPGVSWRTRADAIPEAERSGVLVRSLEARKAPAPIAGQGSRCGVSDRRRTSTVFRPLIHAHLPQRPRGASDVGPWRANDSTTWGKAPRCRWIRLPTAFLRKTMSRSSVRAPERAGQSSRSGAGRISHRAER